MGFPIYSYVYDTGISQTCQEIFPFDLTNYSNSFI